MSSRSVDSKIWKSVENAQFITVRDGQLFTTPNVHEATHFDKPEDFGIVPELVRPVSVRCTETIEFLDCENPQCPTAKEDLDIQECVTEYGLSIGLCQECVKPVKEMMGVVKQ